MTRTDFRKHAAALTAELPGQGVIVLLKPCERASNLGWRGSGAGFVYLAGKPIRVTLTVTINATGSSAWPEK